MDMMIIVLIGILLLAGVYYLICRSEEWDRKSQMDSPEKNWLHTVNEKKEMFSREVQAQLSVDEVIVTDASVFGALRKKEDDYLNSIVQTPDAIPHEVSESSYAVHDRVVDSICFKVYKN